MPTLFQMPPPIFARGGLTDAGPLRSRAVPYGSPSLAAELRITTAHRGTNQYMERDDVIAGPTVRFILRDTAGRWLARRCRLLPVSGAVPQKRYVIFPPDNVECLSVMNKPFATTG